MKYTSLLLAALLLTSCGGWQRVGQMTMVSTRNVDGAQPYVLLVRGAEATAKMKQDDAMQMAVDAAVAQHPGGEYMMNVSVYVKENGKAVKVNGDVWGIASAANTASSVVTGSSDMRTGDRVAFKLGGHVTEGTIVGIRPTSAVVEYTSGTKQLMKELDYSKLTKLQ